MLLKNLAINTCFISSQNLMILHSLARQKTLKLYLFT